MHIHVCNFYGVALVNHSLKLKRIHKDNDDDEIYTHDQVTSPTGHITGHCGDESFQAITCTGTNNNKINSKKSNKPTQIPKYQHQTTYTHNHNINCKVFTCTHTQSHRLTSNTKLLTWFRHLSRHPATK